jgi:hypothetical protein
LSDDIDNEVPGDEVKDNAAPGGATPDDDVRGDASHRLALASSSELAASVRRFGAVYWGRAITGTIEAASVAVVKQTLGEDAYAAALANRDLAAGEHALPASHELDGAVTSAGLCCLAAWCAGQPAAIAQRIRLKLPASIELDGPVVPPFDQTGPLIVERLFG